MIAKLVRDPLFWLGAVCVAAVTALAVSAGRIASATGHAYSYQDAFAGTQRGGMPFAPGHGGFVLGSDWYGADVLVRSAYAARQTIEFMVPAAIAVVLIATILGAVMALGWWPLRLGVDAGAAVLTALPLIPLAFAIQSHFARHPLVGAVIMVAAFTVIAPARTLSALLTTAESRLFVTAARVAGASEWRILTRHLLPHALPGFLAVAGQLAGAVVVIESTLDFFGLVWRPGQAPTLAMLLRVDGNDPSVWELTPWVTGVPLVMLALLTIGVAVVGNRLGYAAGLRPRDR
jgi:peptide/nickel transport system permease protein